MNLFNYTLNFPDESECRILFKNFRKNEGLVCRKCGTEEFYWLSTIEQFKCKKCGARITLRSGTLLENSKLPYRYWLLAIHLIHIKNKSFSVLKLQKELGHKRYQPIAEMLTKIKNMDIDDNKVLIDTLSKIEMEILTNIQQN